MAKRRKGKWKPLSEPKKWNDGKEVTVMKAGKVLEGGKTVAEGVSLTRGGISKDGREYPKVGKFWISSNMNVESWLNWLYLELRDLFHKLWGQEIKFDSVELGKKIELLESEKEGKEKEIESLRCELEEYKTLGEDLEAKKELAKGIKEDSKELDKILKDFRENYILYSYKNDIRHEQQIKVFLEKNKWLLGIDCQFCKKNVPLDNQTQIDMHVVNSFGQNKIYEFKSPNLKPFLAKNGGRLHATPVLSEALDEIINYMKRTDLNAQLISEGGLKIIKPSGIIIIGYNLSSAEKDLLETWNFFLFPHIRIIPYDELLKQAEEEVKLISRAKKEFAKNS